MENYNHEQAGERREYDDRPEKQEEGARHSYSEDSERPPKFYNNREDGRRPNGNYDRNNRRYDRNNEEGGYRPRRSYGQGNEEGGYRPRRQYGQGNEEGGYRPRRQYGQGNDEGNYNRPRRPYGNGSQRRPYGNNQGDGRERPRRQYSDEGYETGNRFADRNFIPEKRSAGTKLRPRKNKPQQGPKPESGIERMIKRNPQLNDRTLSDNDTINIPVKEVVRLNKFIADSGICSRREADNFISAGVVTVNGEVVSELGSKVNIYNDDVRFNGERLRGESKVYIVMNKPKGFVTTASDPHADKTVMDLLKGCNARVFPVGRLDKNTTGVLMFTNDGEIAEKLTHPAYDKKKIYQVTLTDDLKQEDFDKIVEGIPLSDGIIAADALEYVDDDDHKKLGIEIHSGKNRIVRRIFESLGYTVKGLDRVYFAGLTKKGIKRGGWRYLTDSEVNILKMGAYN